MDLERAGTGLSCYFEVLVGKMAGAACILSSHATTGAVAACSSRSQQPHQQQHGSFQLAMPSCSFSGDSVSSFLHAGICSPLRTRSQSLVQRKRVVKPRVVESVLAEIAEENVVSEGFQFSLSHAFHHFNELSL